MKNNSVIESADKCHASLATLIVEDDSSTVVLLEYLFKRHSFQVQVARDGNEAQSIIQSNETPPSVVLLDLMLPYIDGYEILQMIRKSSAWENVPVLILSGKSQEDDIVRAFKLGASDYVVKPFSPNELMARIERLVKQDDSK